MDERAAQQENGGQETAWHRLDANAVARHLGVNAETGYPSSAISALIDQFGPNEIVEKPPRSLARMVLDQFSDFMILILMAAAVISGILGEVSDTIAIIVIVILNAVIGVVQEWRAEKAMEALKKLAAPSAVVVRDGRQHTIPAHNVVPGEIVVLEAGDVVPADIRLFDTAVLRMDESLLTGESTTVEKNAKPLAQDDLPLADLTNMAFKGSSVAYGRGRGFAVATGMRTELGKIAQLLDTEERGRTPLQKRLAAFSRKLGIAVLVICAVIFAAGLLRGEAVLLMFLTAISLAVAAIPEALPAVVTISLALGARKMVGENALVRRLPSVETLGSVTYICSDKTGTLTQNKMRVEDVRVPGGGDGEWRAHKDKEPWHSLFLAMALCNDAERDEDGTFRGDPTEVALGEEAAALGFVEKDLTKERARVFELPFDSERKRMSTVHVDGDSVLAFVKGAPESIVVHCRDMLTADGVKEIDQDACLAEAEAMAQAGLRVLAYAKRGFEDLPASRDHDDVERELTFLGFAGLADPPRETAHKSVQLCRSAGITPVMITGDHPETARAIAHRLGIIEDGGHVMTGRHLDEISDEDFKEEVADVAVFARADPAQKIRIVKALQGRGEFVAMTGDGVNDAPSLKLADIGVAMGKGGTDVAREASSLVLLDDNFSTIVQAVRVGRRIFDNIRKFIKYTMTSNAGEIWTIFLAPFLGLPLPLLPIHILWINLVTDGLPGLALTAEKEEEGIMERPPHPPKESIFAHGMWQHIIWCGLAMGSVSLASMIWAINSGSDNWQTIIFTVLTLSQMGHVLAIRSDRQSLFHQGVFTNMPLVGAVLLTFALQMAVVYVPFLNPIFKTQPLSLYELSVCLALSSVVFIAVEIEKLLIRRGLIYRD